MFCKICVTNPSWSCFLLHLLNNFFPSRFKQMSVETTEGTNDCRAEGNSETNDSGVETNFETLNDCEVIYALPPTPELSSEKNKKCRFSIALSCFSKGGNTYFAWDSVQYLFCFLWLHKMRVVFGVVGSKLLSWITRGASPKVRGLLHKCLRHSCGISIACAAGVNCGFTNDNLMVPASS